MLYGSRTTLSTEMPFVASTNTTKTANNADGLKPGDIFIAATTGGGNCGFVRTTVNPQRRCNNHHDRHLHQLSGFRGRLATTAEAKWHYLSGATGGRITTSVRVRSSISGRSTAAAWLSATSLLARWQARSRKSRQFPGAIWLDEDDDGLSRRRSKCGGNAEWVDTIAVTPLRRVAEVRAVRVRPLNQEPHGTTDERHRQSQLGRWQLHDDPSRWYGRNQRPRFTE